MVEKLNDKLLYSRWKVGRRFFARKAAGIPVKSSFSEEALLGWIREREGRQKRRVKRRKRTRAYKKREDKLFILRGMDRTSCERCGWHEHPWGLDFDHLWPELKSWTPSSLIKQRDPEVALKYLKENCRILCANCHRLKSKAFGEHGRAPSGGRKIDHEAHRLWMEDPRDKL